MKKTNFENWLNKFIEEKDFDLEMIFEVEGRSGMNMMPYAQVIDAILATNEQEQNAIKSTLVQIDFRNGDIGHYFRHLAQAIAK